MYEFKTKQNLKRSQQHTEEEARDRKMVEKHAEHKKLRFHSVITMVILSQRAIRRLTLGGNRRPGAGGGHGGAEGRGASGPGRGFTSPPKTETEGEKLDSRNGHQSWSERGSAWTRRGAGRPRPVLLREAAMGVVGPVPTFSGRLGHSRFPLWALDTEEATDRRLWLPQIC